MDINALNGYPLSNLTWHYLVPKGWECPKCGRCFAPWVRECSHCGKYIQKTATDWVPASITERQLK